MLKQGIFYKKKTVIANLWRKITHNSPKIVTDFMSDDLPFCESCRWHGRPWNHGPWTTARRLLTPKIKIKILNLENVIVNLTDKVASHAIPTSEPEAQPLIKCHKPKLSLLLVPRHCENKDKRKSSSAESQDTFQGKLGSVAFGQL